MRVTAPCHLRAALLAGWSPYVFVEAVQEAIAPNRRLVFDVKQGWQPLCAFLGVPVPDEEPFPRVNDTAAFEDEERQERRAEATRALNT
jgi:Sulfotransferase domain